MSGFSPPFRAALVAALLAAPLSAPISAQEHAHAAAAHDGLGTVHFPTSCRSDVTQRFDRGMAWLHSFEFGAAIREFEAVVASDSTCAMAHWGLAVSRWSNPLSVAGRAPAQLARGRAAAEAAARHASHATPREQAYIAAVGKLYEDYERRDQPTRLAAYERAMADVVATNPDDVEASVFHALSLVATAPPTDKTYANQKRAGALLERLWTQQPNHPGLAHYIIHSYDVPALAPQAAVAAQRYAGIAPRAAHAQHMPSHTFTRVGMWKESAESNRRSAEVALRDSSLAEALHAWDYMVYAFLQMRREADARVILGRLPAVAARYDHTKITGAAPGSAGIFALAAMPARYALERNMWADAAALAPAPSAFAWADAVTWFAKGLGAARAGRPAEARPAVDSLAAMHARLLAAREMYWAEQVAIQRLGAQAWSELAEGRRDAALTTMREAATREDATEKSPVTPGPLMPARELLGDMLMEVGKPGEALAEYRAVLAKEPNRWRALDGAKRAATAAGDRRAADGYARELRTLTRRAGQ